MKKFLAFGASCALICTACSSSESNPGDDTPIESTPLSGMIGGQPWTIQAAQTDAFLSDDSEFWVDAYADAIATPCGSVVTTSSASMILTVPPMPGNYPLGLTLTATFVLNDANSTNLVATRGRLVVDSVTDSQITGGAFIEYDEQNSVNGQLTATICP